MPQSGHEPGPSRTTSGCIGQVYWVPAGATAGAASGSRSGSALRKNCAGSRSNFARQPALQNQYSSPSCSARWGDAGFTVMPQTGSIFVDPAGTACGWDWFIVGEQQDWCMAHTSSPQTSISSRDYSSHRCKISARVAARSRGCWPGRQGWPARSKAGLRAAPPPDFAESSIAGAARCTRFRTPLGRV
jgi:hypothetical protein